MILQGMHHSAQKSTKTGRLVFFMNLSKDEDVKVITPSVFCSWLLFSSSFSFFALILSSSSSFFVGSLPELNVCFDSQLVEPLKCYVLNEAS